MKPTPRRVTVHEYADGMLAVCVRGRYYVLPQVAPEDLGQRKRKRKRVAKRKARKP
jgi:hypothetical protein